MKLREVYVGWKGKMLRIRVDTPAQGAKAPAITGDIVVTPKQALQIAHRILLRVWERQP